MGTQSALAFYVDAPLASVGFDGCSSMPEDSAILTSEWQQVLCKLLPLVRYIARTIHKRLPQHVEFEDLVSAGHVGLMDAFIRFDKGKNVEFRAYASFRIRGAILDSLRDLDWGSKGLRRLSRKIEEAARTLMARLKRDPDDAEVASEIGMSLADYQKAVRDLKGLEIVSLNEPRKDDPESSEIDNIAAGTEDCPFRQCLKGEMKDRLTAAIEDLPEKERLIMTLYYYEELSMREISQILKLHESRISQLHTKALDQLRRALRSCSESTGTPGIGSAPGAAHC